MGVRHPSTYERHRVSVIAPRSNDEFNYRLTNKGDGTIYDCSDPVKLIRILAAGLGCEADERCGPYVFERIRCDEQDDNEPEAVDAG